MGSEFRIRQPAPCEVEKSDQFSTLPGGLHFTGTPEGLADLITLWWQGGAADGFTLQPLRLPLDLALFVDDVMPILRARGVAQRAYGAGTLRDRLVGESGKCEAGHQ